MLAGALPSLPEHAGHGDHRPPRPHHTLSLCPAKAPCPRCGKLGPRKSTHRRLVRTPGYKQVVFLDVIDGEYRARCPCSKTFRTTPPNVEPKARYDNSVRRAVLDRILEDGMSVEPVIAAMRRDFLLDLSDGFVYDLLRARAAEWDMAADRRTVLERFSGTLCVDELHLGRFTPLLATDPLADLPVAFAPVDANDQGHMRRFLQNLKAWGLVPRVVVTDGSNLYPAVLAGLWPDADHLLYVFHLLRDLKRTQHYHEPGGEWPEFSRQEKRLIRDSIGLSKRRGELPAERFASRRRCLQRRLHDLLARGWKERHARRLVKRLRRHEAELFTFLDHPDVPSDNNHAERQIRPAVIVRKNIYANGNEDGAEAQAVLMSVSRTLKQRGHDPVTAVLAAVRVHLKTGQLPPLPERITENG